MAGSAAVKRIGVPNGVVYGFEIYWSTDNNGALSVDLVDDNGLIHFNGTVVQYIYSPDHDYEPEAEYRLWLTGCDGSADLTCGTGEHLTGFFAERHVPFVDGGPLVLNEKLALNGTGIGANRRGWLWIYLR